MDLKFARAAFINQAFSDFYNQQKNMFKRKGQAKHFSTCCKEDEVCYCQQDLSTVLRAFDFVLYKNILLLSSFNKIYCFNEYLPHLKPSIQAFMEKKNNFIEHATLIGELQLQEEFPMDNVLKGYWKYFKNF